MMRACGWAYDWRLLCKATFGGHFKMCGVPPLGAKVTEKSPVAPAARLPSPSVCWR